MSASSLKHIPGSLGLPFVGDLVNFLKYPIETFQAKQIEYGDVFKMRLLGKQVVFITGAEATKQVLIEQAKYFSAKEGWEISIGELFSGGLMLKDGEEHKYHRSILQSAFKKEPMAGYLADIVPTAARYLQAWQHKTELQVFPAMKALTLQIAGKVFFGLDFSADLERVNQAIIQVVKASTPVIPLAIPFTTYWRGLRARRFLEKYFKSLIAERRTNPTPDIFGRLCIAENEAGDRLTDQQIVAHLIFLLMAGHDTTASTLTSLIYELAMNPEWQERLREKSLAFQANQTISLQSIHALEELEWAMRETLRLHPPLILIPRRTQSAQKIGDYDLPANTSVALLIFHNHAQDKYWLSPERFDPERFADTRAEHKKCPHAYTPFGAGQHHCLGYAFAEMQIKAVMHLLLCKYQWSVPTDYKVAYRAVPLQEPKDGLPVKLTIL
jgi:cytochrome P450